MKKLICLFLSLVFVVTMLCACGGDPDTTPNDPNVPSVPNEPNAPDERPEEGTVAGVLYDFEKKNYDIEFLTAASNSVSSKFSIDQFPVNDGIVGQTVQDALFSRDRAIEEHLGIKLVYDDVPDYQMFDKIANTIRSGDDIYSLILGRLYDVSVGMFQNDLVYDLRSIDTIDLTQSYWNQNSVDAFTLNDKTFMATGAITNRYIYAPYALLFNMRLLNDIGQVSPYELIENEIWTFENFRYMIMDTYAEINGNDDPDIGDFYGLAPADDSQTAWFFAAGGRFSNTNEDGEIIPVYEEANHYNLLTEVLEFHKTTDVMKYNAVYDSLATFKEGRAVFHAVALGDINMLADMEDKYGIVPLPKYDDDQEHYYSNTNKYVNTMALIPTSVKNTSMVGNIVEAMAAVSQVTSLDKQYDTVLLHRQALDAQSKASLQLVVEASSYDWIYVLDPASVSTQIRLAMKGESGSKEFSSFFASVREPVQSALDELEQMHQ